MSAQSAIRPLGQFTLAPEQLKLYLLRIGFNVEAESIKPTLQTLCELHFRHTTSIPFENLTLVHPSYKLPQNPQPVQVDIEVLFEKLVTSKRGGYCFESNVLFAAVLRTCGFNIYTGMARVAQPPEAGDPPDSVRLNEHHSHVIHHVLLPDGSRWLADVATAGKNPLFPLRVEDVPESDPPDIPMIGSRLFRLRRGVPYSTREVSPEEGAAQPHRYGWYVQMRVGEAWSDVHFFTLMEALHGDLLFANHWMSTHPTSRWLHMLLVARSVDGGYDRLHDWRLQRYREGRKVEDRELEGEEERDAVLRKLFGLGVEGGAGAVRNGGAAELEAVALVNGV